MEAGASTESLAALPPLDDPNTQIRLLRLGSADFDDDISCTVYTCSLADLSAFNAISYTWGPEEPQRQILIDGKPFNVRQNCHYGGTWQPALLSKSLGCAGAVRRAQPHSSPMRSILSFLESAHARR